MRLALRDGYKGGLATSVTTRFYLAHMPRLGRARRTMLALLALCVALGGAGLACNGGNYGITYVGTDAEGSLVAGGRFAQFDLDLDLYRSGDGGRTWQEVGETHPDTAAGPLTATTPRGVYWIGRSDSAGSDLGRPQNEGLFPTLDARIVPYLGRSE